MFRVNDRFTEKMELVFFFFCHTDSRPLIGWVKIGVAFLTIAAPDWESIGLPLSDREKRIATIKLAIIRAEDALSASRQFNLPRGRRCPKKNGRRDWNLPERGIGDPFLSMPYRQHSANPLASKLQFRLIRMSSRLLRLKHTLNVPDVRGTLGPRFQLQMPAKAIPLPV